MIHVREASGVYWAFLWDDAAATQHTAPGGTAYATVDEGSIMWADFATQAEADGYARANEAAWINRSRAWKAYCEGQSVVNKSWLPWFRQWADEAAAVRGDLTLDQLVDNIMRGAYA